MRPKRIYLYSLPYQTAYTYPASDKVIIIVFALAFLAAAIYSFCINGILTGIIAVLGFILFGVFAVERLNATEPLLLINNDGITTKEHGFHQWRDIRNEHIFWVSAGKASHHGLSYEADNKVINMSLRDITGLSSQKVDHVLRTYRGRYQAAKSQKLSLP